MRNSHLKTNKAGTLITYVGVFSIIVVLLIYGIPWWSRLLTESTAELPVPDAILYSYILLAVVVFILYISSDDERLNSVLSPVVDLLNGFYGKRVRVIILTPIPVLVGWFVYINTIPDITPPLSLRIQHPSSNFPIRYEKMKNPFRDITDAHLDLFISEVKEKSVKFLPQLEMKPGGIEFIPTESVQIFIKELNSGIVNRTHARKALYEKNLFEGRILYEINCRPCHGHSAAGDGPMSYGFTLRPINFMDNGTIETVVEGYIFWRVSKGGRALPNESTPWDSAMPSWESDLTSEEIWKIILALYDMVEKNPSVLSSNK